uniref:Putative secreted protein n=1 Tax=Rhipicephalus microplus TaxID=6941 RepID=A0A6M2DC66_RHIMP
MLSGHARRFAVALFLSCFYDHSHRDHCDWECLHCNLVAWPPLLCLAFTISTYILAKYSGPYEHTLQDTQLKQPTQVIPTH